MRSRAVGMGRPPGVVGVRCATWSRDRPIAHRGARRIVRHPDRRLLMHPVRIDRHRAGEGPRPLADGGGMTVPDPDAPLDPEPVAGIPAYLAPYVVTALAAAPEVAALDLEVRDVGGALFVHGTVESAVQRAAAIQVAR